MKRALSVLVLLVAGLVSTALGFWTYERFTASPPQSTAAKQTAVVRRGSIAATVSTSGSTAPVYTADLSFEAAGRLKEVLAGAGESVKKGQILATLDTTDLELQVSRAEVALESAKIKLQQLRKGPEPSEVAAAQASYDSAVDKLNKLKAGTSAEDLAVAKASYDSALEKLTKLKAGTSADDLAVAKASYESALEKLANLQAGTSADSLALAQASYDSAIAKVEELKAKPTADEIKTAEAAVRDAEVALANAQNSLMVTQKSRTVTRAVVDLENEHNWYEANYGDKLAKFNARQATQADVDKAWNDLMAAKERLDTARAESANALRKAQNDLTKAEESLAKARTTLDQVRAGASAQDVQTAEAAALKAKLDLQAKQEGPSTAEIATAEAAAQKAKLDWQTKQAGASAAEIGAAEAAVQKAKLDWQTKREGASAADLKVAEAAVLSAKSQVETKVSGTSVTDIAAQEVAVREAQLTLRERQLSLQKATVSAPFDGVIDTVSVKAGEQAAAGKVLMTIVGMKDFLIQASVVEDDVVRLAVGQSGTATIEALANQGLQARVTSIAPKATVQQGVVSYSIKLQLDPTEAAIRPGMSASVTIEVERRNNVLLAPNRAVRTQGRQRIVEVLLPDGQTETRQVRVGMSNDQFTEIMEGLQEGEQAVIPGTTTAPARVPQSAAPGGVFGVPAGR